MTYALAVHSIIVEPCSGWARVTIHPTFHNDTKEKPYVLELRADQALNLLDWVIQTNDERSK